MAVADIASMPRETKIDFINKNVIFSGKKMTKTKLRNLPDDKINKICEKFKKECLDFVNNPPAKLIKFFADCTDKKTGANMIHEGRAGSEDAFKKGLTAAGFTINKITPARGHHLCKYCYGIAEGSDKNMLCDNCRNVFGHTFYSEL